MRENSSLRAILALSSLLRERGIEIVHTLDIRSNFLGRLAAWRAGIPAIVATRHEMFYSPWFSPMKKVRRFSYLVLDRLTAHLCRRFIVVSRAVGEELVRWERILRSKVSLIYNGVSLQQIAEQVSPQDKSIIAGEFGISESHQMVGSVGRLAPPKGYDVFIQTAAKIVSQISNVTFLLVGEGDERHRLETLVKEMGLDKRFIFTGFQRDVLKFINSFDVFVLPSLYEGFPLTLLEAMGLSKPVVACNVGGVSEIVENGRTGILVSPRDPKALAEAILTMLRDRNRAGEMGRAGRRIVEERFQYQKMINETAEVYEAVLGRL
jgi:glycosyltransferase involved in cell wall biosynthesis